jgi:DHA2 family multidrug resistance protein
MRALEPRSASQGRDRTNAGTLHLQGVTERYRWTAVAVVLIGTFMVILDTTIVSVALEPIGAAFGSQSWGVWIVTVYLLTVGVMQPVTAWFADRIGRKPVFVAAMGIFATGSLACAVAPSMGLLVASRALQGLAGGALVPVGMALIYELFPPHRRGTALGIWGVSAMAAPALGPTLGGWLATHDWRLVFLINVPIGAAGVVAGSMLLRNTGYRERRRLDGFGIVLTTVGVLALLLGFSEGTAWGWTAPRTLLAIVVGVALLLAFVAWSKRTAFPVVDVRLFRIPVFTSTVAVICLLSVYQYSRLVFLPLELQSLRGYTPLHTGVVLLPTAIGSAAVMPLAGRLADTMGSKVLVAIGLAIATVPGWFFGHLTPDTSDTTLAVLMLVGGIGFGLATMPNTVAGLNSVPAPFVAQASAARQLCRQITAAIAVAVLTAVAGHYLGADLAFGGGVSRTRAQAGYNVVFICAFWATIAAAVLALVAVPGRAKMRQLQAERQAEQEELLGQDPEAAESLLLDGE